MKFEHMKVATRLAAGFALLVLASVCIAVIGRVQLGRLDDELRVLIEDRMVKVEQTHDLIDNLNLVARSVRNIVLLSDPEGMREEKARIDKARAANTDLFAKLQNTVRSEKGRAALQVALEARAPYTALTDKAIELGMADKDEEARGLLLGELRDKQTAYFKSLDALIEYQQGLVRSSAESSEATVATAGYGMLAMAVLAAVIGTLTAWALTRALTRSLGGEPHEVSAAVQRVAAGDLCARVPVREGDATSVMASVARMQASLSTIIGTVRSGVESVATASSQIAQGNVDLSQRTEEQASSLQQTAASMEQMSAAVKSGAEGARAANQLACSASAVAEQGGSVVARVVSTMGEIQDASKKIAEIIGTIDGIAFQTNILALNAAVEAARAGEQGRGFAVVATEVRGLAQRSAEAARQVKTLIGASVERVDAGTALVDQAGRTMGEIVGQVRKVTDLIGEIAAGSNEQAGGISQVNTAVAQLDKVTQQNAALVEQSTAAAESLKQQAARVSEAVAVFKLAA